LRYFGEIVQLHQNKERNKKKRMLVYLKMNGVQNLELLIKSNITRYIKLIAESNYSDTDSKHCVYRWKLAGRVELCNEFILMMSKAKEEFKKNNNLEEE